MVLYGRRKAILNNPRSGFINTTTPVSYSCIHMYANNATALLSLYLTNIQNTNGQKKTPPRMKATPLFLYLPQSVIFKNAMPTLIEKYK